MANVTEYVVKFRGDTKSLKEACAQLKKCYDQQGTGAAKAQKTHQKKAQEEQKKEATHATKIENMRKRSLTDRGKIQYKQWRDEENKIKKQIQINTNARKAEIRDQSKFILWRTKQERSAQTGGLAGATGGRVSGGGLRQAFGAVARPAAGVATGIAGMIVGALMSGYQKFVEYGVAKSQLAGLGTRHGRSAPGAQTMAGIRGAHGSRLGYSLTDTAEQALPMARATGVLGPRELQQVMRSTAMGAGETADLFGTMRRAGTSFEPGTAGAGRSKTESAGGRQFSQLIAGGLKSGLERARLPEYLQGVQGLVEQQRQVQTGVIGIGDIAKQLSLLGRGGSGMQGAAGAAILGKMNAAMGTPGGGEAGDAFMNQAMGFGKPGGGVSYYESQKRREKGVGDPENMVRVMKEVAGQYGTGEEGNLALREMTGVSLDQAEKLQQIYNSGASADDKLKEIEKVMKESDSIEKQALDQMKIVGSEAKHIAGLTDKGIAEGAKIAPAVHAMEETLHKILDKVLAVLEDTYKLIKALYQEYLEFRGKTPEAIAQKMKDVFAGPKTPISNTEQMMAQQKQENSAVRSAINTANEAGSVSAGTALRSAFTPGSSLFGGQSGGEYGDTLAKNQLAAHEAAQYSVDRQSATQQMVGYMKSKGVADMSADARRLYNEVLASPNQPNLLDKFKREVDASYVDSISKGSVKQSSVGASAPSSNASSSSSNTDVTVTVKTERDDARAQKPGRPMSSMSGK